MRWKLQSPSPALVVACIALLVALGPAVRADNTILSSDIVNGEVRTEDLGDFAVTIGKIALNAIVSSRVADSSLTGIDVLNESLTSADLKGADFSSAINLGAGAVVNGRCSDFAVATPGAGVSAGEAVLVSLQGAVAPGMLIYGVRAPSLNTITLKICNLTGGASPAIVNLPFRVLTFG